MEVSHNFCNKRNRTPSKDKVWRGFPLFVALKNGQSTVTKTGWCILSCQFILSPCFRAVALFQVSIFHWPKYAKCYAALVLHYPCPPTYPDTTWTSLTTTLQIAAIIASTHLTCNLFCWTTHTTIWPALSLQHLICCRLVEGTWYPLIRRLFWLLTLIVLMWRIGWLIIMLENSGLADGMFLWPCIPDTII